jgi:acyl-homoserine lactone acylase PvdQ
MKKRVVIGRTVPGADGFGKVQLRYKTKPPLKGHRVLGFFVYGFFFSLIALSFCWSFPSLRYRNIFPGARAVLGALDYAKEYGAKSPAVQSKTHGVSLVVGSSTKDLMHAQGYLHASDRLMQMEIYRRMALGTLSEWYGNSTVPRDKLYRTLNLGAIAMADVDALSLEESALLQSYADGINAYLIDAEKGGLFGELVSTLPLDFDLFLNGFGELLQSRKQFPVEKWLPFHTLAILRLVGYQWSRGSWEKELQRALVADKLRGDPNLLFSEGGPWGEEDDWLSPVTSPSPSPEGKDGAAAAAAAGDQEVQELQDFLPALGGVAVAVSGSKSRSRAALLANSVTNAVSTDGQIQ